ncbi:hypothetical protein DAPPUDRAFT_314911 [Daphnia pulex]|uniref:Transporter n=1 Tax=Daphnia pulex TaxID=6669 RepID=E9G7X0_DAPPU|nr:hypothetical protein DAPPUDRAFT_314911 [Daphnia pulex]|eukprot:EFX84589.1 hypothetical protein DAPPUDRAFT_314911 [Daphnia pulex]
MANVAQLIRRQSSRELLRVPLDRLELRELQHRLLPTPSDQANAGPALYGTTNAAFVEDGGAPSSSSPSIIQQQHLNLGSSGTSNTASSTTRNRLTSLDRIDEKEEHINGVTGGTAGIITSSDDNKGVDVEGAAIVGQTPSGADPSSGDERENWDSKLSFLLATIGYAVGLGNVWRFPYLAQKNGGGAFLIPYAIMLAVEGLPIVFLELAIGQRLRKGAIGVWAQISPYLGGIGIASTVVSFNVALYYNTIIAWCLYYLFQSFQYPLPWSECPKEYFENGSYAINMECKQSSPTQYFWYRETLDISPDINTPQSFNWKITLCLFIAWLMAYLCMAKGIASSGKVVYITATFPYIVLIIFFVRGMTLHGMADGLTHLFTPKWEKLADPVVWLEAGTQIFFSLGLAFGGLIAFSSYNPVSNHCYRDAILVSLTNFFTSMFAAVVIFSVIGFKARMTYENCLETRNQTLVRAVLQELPVCDLQQELDNTASGTGLAFIICTEAVNQFPLAPLWSVLFFLMLLTLGIDSQFGTLEGVITSIVDLKIFPRVRKEILTATLCGFCCVLSIIFTHGAGNYIFTLFDDFSGNVPLLIIAFFECIAVSYFYGLDRFANDIELMTGSRPGIYWMICWKYLSPLTMLIIVIASFAKIIVEGSGYLAWVAEAGTTRHLDWPPWAQVLIAVLVLVSALWIPGIAIARMFGCQPLADEPPAWFPADELREFRKLTDVHHQSSTMEKLLFCIHDDGTEGLCFPTSSSAQSKANSP